MAGRLEGKRVLVTHADRYIGPPVVELFRAEGAAVVADTTDPTTGPEAAAQIVGGAGEIDVIVANFAGPHRRMPVTSMLGDVTGFTDEMLADDDVRGSFEVQIPAGRLGEGREAAELALASGASDFLAGQVVPVSGGWAT